MEGRGILPLLTPPLSTLGWLTVGWLQKPRKVEKRKKSSKRKKKKIVSLHANISDTPFDQSSPVHREVGVLNCHRPTNRQTDGHCDSMTESDSVKMKHHMVKTLMLGGVRGKEDTDHYNCHPLGSSWPQTGLSLAFHKLPKSLIDSVQRQATF